MATDKDRQLLFKNKGKDSDVSCSSNYQRVVILDILDCVTSNLFHRNALMKFCLKIFLSILFNYV